jgi:DNA gyrase subunit B
MRDLIDRGYLYIAQPPLYKVKKGQSERYIKDEGSLRDHLIGLALSSMDLIGEGNATPIPADDANELLRVVSEYDRIIERMLLRRTDDRIINFLVLGNLLNEEIFHSEDQIRNQLVPSIEEHLRSGDFGDSVFNFLVTPDPEHGGFTLTVETRRTGITYRVELNNAFFNSPDFQHLMAYRDRMRLLGQDPFRLRDSNGEEEEVKTHSELLKRVLERGQKGLGISRYKGLGEMNPDQLSDTTMNADLRTLLQVKIEDAVEADQIFTTLMGDVVEPRREFIEKNALNVQNLDV